MVPALVTVPPPVRTTPRVAPVITPVASLVTVPIEALPEVSCPWKAYIETALWPRLVIVPAFVTVPPPIRRTALVAFPVIVPPARFVTAVSVARISN